jgi:hypothetical protein
MFGGCRNAVLRYLPLPPLLDLHSAELFPPLHSCVSRHSASYCVFSPPLPSFVCFSSRHPIVPSSGLDNYSTVQLCFWWNFTVTHTVGASMCFSRSSPRVLAMPISLHMQLYSIFQIASRLAVSATLLGVATSKPTSVFASSIPAPRSILFVSETLECGNETYTMTSGSQRCSLCQLL